MAVNSRTPSGVKRKPNQYVMKDKKGKVIRRTKTPKEINVYGKWMDKGDKQALDQALDEVLKSPSKAMKKKPVIKKKVAAIPKKKIIPAPPSKIERPVVKKGLKQKAKPTSSGFPASKGGGSSYSGQELKKRKTVREGASVAGGERMAQLLQQAKGEMESQSNWDTLIAGATPILAGLLAGDVGTGVDTAAQGVLDVYGRSQEDARGYNKRLLDTLSKQAAAKSKSKTVDEVEYFENPDRKFLGSKGMTPGQKQFLAGGEFGLAEREQTRKELSTELGYEVDMAKMESAMATREFQESHANYRVRLKEAGLDDRTANKLANQLTLKEMGGTQAMALQQERGTQASALQEVRGDQAMALQQEKGAQAQSLQEDRLASREGIATADREQEGVIATRKANLEEWKAELANENTDEDRKLKEALSTVEQNFKEWQAKKKFKQSDRELDLKEREVNIKDFEAFTKRKALLNKKTKEKDLKITMGDIRGLRNDYGKSKEVQRITKSSSGVRNMAANLVGHGGQDIGFLYDFVTAMDPESVVREGEITFSQEGLPWAGRIQKLWSQAHNTPEGVKILSQELKNSMMKAVILRQEQSLISFDKYAAKQNREVRALGVGKEHFNADASDFHAALKKAKAALAKAGGGKVQPFTSGGGDNSFKKASEGQEFTIQGKRYIKKDGKLVEQ